MLTVPKICPNGNMRNGKGKNMAYIRIDDKKHKTQHEGNEQKMLFEWAFLQRKKYPELDLLYHIPNGGQRNTAEAARLKCEGVKAGVPDIHLPVARGRYHSLYIEMKYGKNKPTEKQKEWLSKLALQGNFTAVCYGWESAAKLITDYLNLKETIH